MFGVIWTVLDGVSPGGNDSKETTTVSFSGPGIFLWNKCGSYLYARYTLARNRFASNSTEMLSMGRSLTIVPSPGFLFYYSPTTPAPTTLSLPFILLPFIMGSVAI